MFAQAITQALGTEIESVADVLAREKEIIANAEASKKDVPDFFTMTLFGSVLVLDTAII